MFRQAAVALKLYGRRSYAKRVLEISNISPLFLCIHEGIVVQSACFACRRAWVRSQVSPF